MSNIAVSPQELRYRYAQYLESTKEVIEQKTHLQTIGLKHRILKPDNTIEDVYDERVIPLMKELDAIVNNLFDDIVIKGSRIQQVPTGKVENNS